MPEGTGGAVVVTAAGGGSAGGLPGVSVIWSKVASESVPTATEVTASPRWMVPLRAPIVRAEPGIAVHVVPSLEV